MSKEKKSNLSESSRLSGNVLEYYMKYGRERDLEKFMRFRSPKNSPVNSSSSNEECSKHLSCEHLNRISAEKMESKSQSMPSISNSSSQSEPKEHIVPIRLESETGQDVPSTSVLKTPQQQSAEKPKQIKTPESVAKAHKRLEWDSLGDVGYEKSKSTSNVSIVERMLLREFFEVTSNTQKQTNSSESDIRYLEQEIADLGTLKKHFFKSTQKDESKYDTPPLAHSTQYESSNAKKNSMRTKVKSVQASTNTTSSLQQKFEKYAQTSLRNAEMKSQEIQVTLRPTDASPNQVSSSVSSFEYHSRPSTNSSGTKSTASSNVLNHLKTSDDAQHPFVKGVKEMLEKRKVLGAKNDKHENSSNEPVQESENLKRLYTDFQQMIGEDKENSSTSSEATSSSNASTIDFGIQLIFNIMKAKTVDPQQKKKLVKNIVKRITKIANSRELHGIVRKTSALFTTETEEDSRSMQRKISEENASIHSRKTTSFSVVSDVNISNVSSQTDHLPLRNSSEKLATQTKQTVKEKVTTEFPNEQSSSISREQKHESVKRSTGGRSTGAAKRHIPASSNNATSTASTSSGSPKGVQVTLSLGPNCGIIGAVATEMEYTASACSTTATETTTTSTVTSSATSHDPPTQKPAKTNDQAVNMQEWLNPMTQSEIEFEKKKSAKLKAKRLNSKTTSNKDREQQLNWIAAEIERLESLRNLLLKDDTRQSTEAEVDVDVETEDTRKQNHKTQQQQSNTTQTSDQLYDTVYSDPSMKSSSVPQQKSTTSSPIKTNKSSKPSESSKKINKQRSKIDTPSDSHDQESVSSLVRRRKKELLNHYQPHKMHHCTCMTQPCIIERPTTSTAAALHGMVNQFVADSCGFYAQPMNMQPNVPPVAYYTYPPPTHTQMHWQNYADPRMHPQSSGPTGPREAGIGKSTHFHSMPSTSTHAPPASSSAFRGSSELTVPMGSYATSATPTTTHQYDDVAAAAAGAVKQPTVGSQTGPSLQRSRPIYETRCASPHKSRNVMPYTSYMTACGPVGRSTICVQTQPSRSTAYALQFVVREQPENSTSGSSSTTTESTTSSTSEELRILAAQAGPSLQDALQQRRPEFLKNAKNRKSVINRIQKLRQEREQELRKIADDNLSATALDKKLNDLPPPATEQLRLFSTKEMKALSKKRIVNLPEVVAGQDRQRDERNKRSNRLLREVYNRRLQKRVRDGKLDFQHSRTLI